MDELLKEYTKLVGKVAEANYEDVDKNIPRIVEIREKMDKDLKKLKEIKHLLKVSLIKNLIELIEDE